MSGMIICELRFAIEDKGIPGYSLVEIDYYGSIPFKFHETMPNHRLTLRKNLKDNCFEIFAHFHRRDITPSEQVLFSSPFLSKALAYGNDKWNEYWATKDYSHLRDSVCKHTGNFKETSNFCPKVTG